MVNLNKVLLAFLLSAAISLAGCSGKANNTGTDVVDPGSRKVLKPALIRLEDVGPGGPYQSEENLHKLYTIAVYLHQEGVPFHISLIPRIVVPSKNYDVSIGDDTPYTRTFINTIKNMEKLGGIVGVHGYTHQSGKDNSAAGFEFYDRVENPSVPDAYEFARERADKAFALFLKTGIKPAYWETPHYTASIKQHPAFEEQTGLLYENNHRGEAAGNYKVIDHHGNGFRGYITVPAPLGNIDKSTDVEKMIKRLDNMGNDLASFFYHPFREFKYMYKEYNSKGEPYYVYDQNSPLHVLIRSFREKGYTFVPVYSLARFVPAQRLESIPFSEGDAVVAGQFVPGGGSEILVCNKTSKQWHMHQYTAQWYSPRREKAFADLGVWLKDWAPEKDSVLLAGDFTGNKRDDLMVFSPGQGTFRLLENQGGRLSPVERIFLSTGNLKPADVMSGDFNGDGLADLAVFDREGARIGLSFNTGNGFRPILWQYSDLLKEKIHRPFTGDFNGDRRTDIVLYDSLKGQWNVYLTGPRGTLHHGGQPWIKNWGSGDSWHPIITDINGDGKSDLALYNRTGHWQTATSDGRSFVFRGDFGPWGAGPKALTLAADLNGDRKSDLIIVDGARGRGYNLDTAISVMDMR
ncbi:MAG: DUF2334 domain-containing protein [Bacillota bacterium]